MSERQYETADTVEYDRGWMDRLYEVCVGTVAVLQVPMLYLASTATEAMSALAVLALCAGCFAAHKRAQREYVRGQHALLARYRRGGDGRD